MYYNCGFKFVDYNCGFKCNKCFLVIYDDVIYVAMCSSIHMIMLATYVRL